MNKKIRNLTLVLLISLIPLLTACNIKVPTSIDEVKDLFAEAIPEAAKDTQPAKVVEESPFEEQTATSPLGKLEEILGMKKAMECTYTYQELEGKVYTDGTNARIQAKIKMGDQLLNTNSIYTADYLYTWSENQTTGAKIAIKNFEQEAKDKAEKQEPEKSLPETPDYLADMNYTCVEKDIDSSEFSLPEGVEFMELNIPEVTDETAKTDSVDLCKMCDSIPLEDEKSACKTELKCD